jgi:hypothetical protein
MLRAGLGYGVLPASAIQQDILDGDLSGAPIEDFCVTRMLATPHGRPLRRAAVAVTQTIRSEVAAIIAAGKLGWQVPPAEPFKPGETALSGPSDARSGPGTRRRRRHG